MDSLCLPSNHYFFNSAGKIKKICAPFFSQYEITFFDYARFYRQGDFYGLTVDADSFKIFFELQYEPVYFCRDYFFENDKWYYHFSALSNTDLHYSHILQEIYKVTRSDHGFIILRKQSDYVDTYFFSSSCPYNLAINNYLNLLPSFIKFLFYFQEEANQLLNKSHENRIILPNKMLPDAWNESNDKLKLTSKCIEHNVLTNRQIECLLYLVKGMTIKEISKEMNLAPKTIEHYLDAVKIKLNCHSRSSLIAKALTMSIIKDSLLN